MGETEVNYRVSIYASKFLGYQSKSGRKGIVKLYISNIWKWADGDFSVFWKRMIAILLMERICLERAFNKIRIKGGKCNPCCVKPVALEMYEFILLNPCDQ